MRRFVDRLVTTGAGACAVVAAGLFVAIVVLLVVRGAPALSLPLLIAEAQDAGVAGGLRYQIAGTLILMATALAVSAPVAVALALFLTVYGAPGLRRGLETALYLWNGIPSVVLGIFGLLLFGKLLGWGKSWLGGGVLLGVMILPAVTVNLVERIRAIPPRYLEAARGLGLGRTQVVRAVVLPQSRSGLFTGALLGLARAAGETAPILFTAAVFSGATLPTGVRESPVLALPYHIFVLAQDSLDPAAGARLWASACVLLGLVFGLSLAALPLRLRSHEEGHRG
jgi:phosphate transport system permease protein